MPGTIQVSVLEFMVLQSSSSSSSRLPQMSIKVSMGKQYYQTRDKGDFSFPLTTLRDKLIVTLQDAEGKEVSHTVVDTRLVIEKGIWDDIFQLEGGGHVHMKLQFILSEEDRHRIRIMRESALRKKHDELLKSEFRSPPHATTFGSDLEVTDSHKSLVQSEVIQRGKKNLISATPSTLFTNEKSDPEDKEGSHSIQKQTKPNDTDRYEVTSSITPVSSSRFDVRLEGVSLVRSVENSPIAILEEGEANSTREKTPSKIRSMISAFESGLNKDIKPKRGPTSIKSQSVEGCSNEDKIENAELAQISGSVGNAIHTRDLQLAPSLIRKREKQTKGTMEDLKDREKVEQKVKIEEVKPSNEDFARASTSGRMPNERGTHPWSNFFSRRRLSGEKILKQKGGKGNKQKDIQHVNNQGRSSADEPYSFESNGAWIFPDGGKRLCITTTGKQIMNITEGFFSEAKEQLGNLSSPVAGNVKQGKEDGDTSQRCEESEIDDFTDAETPRGPVGQVMKVVIMVGFATLVLFTRQTKPDK